MAALPAEKPISIYQGDTFTLAFRLRAKTSTGTRGDYINLTGAQVKAQIRATETSSTVQAEFAVSLPPQLGDSVGQVTIFLTPTQTTALVDVGVWDLQVTFPDNSVHTILRGPVEIWKDVTR